MPLDGQTSKYGRKSTSSLDECDGDICLCELVRQCSDHYGLLSCLRELGVLIDLEKTNCKKCEEAQRKGLKVRISLKGNTSYC